MFFKILFGLIVTFLLFKLYKRWRIASRLMLKFRVPPSHPITGCLLYFPSDSVGVFQHLLSYYKNYGKNLINMGILYEIALLVSNPSDIETLLSKTNPKLMKKATDYDYLNPWLGTGILTGYGEKWYKRRKILTPSFHFNILEEFVTVFNQQSDIFIEKLKKFVNQGDFDIYYPARLFTLDVVCETAMGIRLNSQSQPESEYVNAVKEMTELMHKNFFSIIRHITFLYYMTKTCRKEKNLVKILHKFTTNIITQRREVIIDEMENDLKAFRSRKNMNLLDILLQTSVDEEQLSNEDIREEVDTFMFAGHDTSSSVLAFTIYLLSKNQDVQEKLYVELVNVFGENKFPNTSYNDLNELKYLEMVIKESLRIFPPVPFIGRHLKEDTVIEDTIIPSDTDIILGIYPMHHDPEYYPEPEKFIPERFDLNREPTWPKFAYIPFSVGPRNCIGQKFAMLELKCTLLKLILNYKIIEAKEQKELKLQADITLKSANGIHIQLETRT